MDCKEFSNLLHSALDGELAPETVREMTDHGKACDACAARYRMAMDLRLLDEDVEAPEEFSSSWRRMIRQEADAQMQTKNSKKNHWQHLLAVAAALIFVVGGTLATRDELALTNPAGAARGNNAYEYGMAESADYSTSNTAARGMMMMSGAPKAMSAPGAAMSDSIVTDSSAVREEKIIRNASFTVKTLQFEQDLDRIQQLTAEMGGRVEYVSTSGDRENGELRYGSLTLRVPSARLDEFLSGAQMVGRLTALQQDAQDVSDNYYDVQARLQTQQTKMARLQELLVAAQDVSDLIQIENSIADTQYMLDSYMAQLQNYDSRVEYSTVRVTMREIEVLEAEEASFGERISAGLHRSLGAAIDFLRDAVIFLVAALPWLAAAAVLVLCGVWIVRIRRRKKA